MSPEQKTSIRIAVAQINFDPQDVEGHLDKVRSIIRSHCHADLIVFPELIMHGHPSVDRPEGYLFRKVKAIDPQVFRDMYQFIAEQEARVILGELHRRGDHFINRATLADASGIQSYTKTHVHWTENFTPGERLRAFDTPFGKVGISICFDSAFSEVWRGLALAGAEVAVNIAAVPEHFPVKYMHRRLEGAATFNQFYVVYANRPGPVFAGGSAVYSPRGDMIHSVGDQEEVFTLNLDLAEVRRWREEEAIFAHRRPLIYRELTNRAKFIPGTGEAKRRSWRQLRAMRSGERF